MNNGMWKKWQCDLRTVCKKHWIICYPAQVTDTGILSAYKPGHVTPLQNTMVPHYSKLLDSLRGPM